MYQASLIFDNELTPKLGVSIPVGIHTNCVVRPMTKGEGYYDLNFEDSEGRTQHKRLFDPNGKYPRDGETTSQAIEREGTRNLTHVVKLLHIFLGEEAIRRLPAMDYSQFMEKAMQLLTEQVLNSKRVNLMLIYDSDGVYSQFGNYANYVEEYVVGQEPTLKYSKWEQANRLTPAGSPKSDTPSYNDL